MNAVSPINPPADTGENETIESTWNDNIARELLQFGDLVQDVKKSRKALNAKVQAGKTALIDRGFHPGAIEAAMSYNNTPEEDRANWDQSYLFTRKALGCPIQKDMFDQSMQDEITVHHKPKADKAND